MTEDAAKILRGLELTDDNYLFAASQLQERFGREQAIIGEHFYALQQLRKVDSLSDVSGLRDLHNEVTFHVRSLTSLGETEKITGCFLEPMITRKLPRELVTRWNRESDDSRSPNLTALMAYFLKHIEAEEDAPPDSSTNHRLDSGVIDSSGQRSNHQSRAVKARFEENYNRHGGHGTISAFSGLANRRCLLCNKTDHVHYDCLLEPKERWEAAKGLRLCFYCL